MGLLRTVSASGSVTQPIQWSSEFNDTELGLIYYNYRHYNPVDGRWISRDIVPQLNLYTYAYGLLDWLGLDTYGYPKSFWKWAHKHKKPQWVREARKTGKGIRSKNCPKNVEFPKNPDVPKDVADKWYREWENLGRPDPDNKGKHKKRNNKDDDDNPPSDSYEPEEIHEPSTERDSPSTDENKYNEWGKNAAVGLVVAGVVIIGVTIVADVITAGISIADDPATISAGASMIYQGFRFLRRY